MGLSNLLSSCLLKLDVASDLAFGGGALLS